MEREINQEIEKKSLVPEAVVEEYVAAHKSATENWQNGSNTSSWIDEDGNVCICYESGAWWHYGIENGERVWW